jgi:hypothetical protein
MVITFTNNCLYTQPLTTTYLSIFAVAYRPNSVIRLTKVIAPISKAPYYLSALSVVSFLHPLIQSELIGWSLRNPEIRGYDFPYCVALNAGYLA